jgi:hypothetical protein
MDGVGRAPPRRAATGDMDKDKERDMDKNKEREVDLLSWED